jgi:hypothetical protein
MQQGHELHHLEQANDILAKYGAEVYDTIARVPKNLPGPVLPPYPGMERSIQSQYFTDLG